MTRFVVSLWVPYRRVSWSEVSNCKEVIRGAPSWYGTRYRTGTVREELEKNGVTLFTRDVPRVSESVVSSN
jgi:hypothetical protein